jgi:hypothetical protein
VVDRLSDGPWRIHSNAITRLAMSWWYRIIASDGYLVGVVRRPADARLIAAAPEMRAELEVLAAQLEEWEARRLLPVGRAKHIRALLSRIDKGVGS